MSTQRHPIEHFFSRTLWAPTGLISLALVAALVALAISLGSSINRLQPLHNYLEQLNHLEQTSLTVENALLARPNDPNPLSEQQFTRFKSAVAVIARSDAHLQSDTADQLHNVAHRLASPHGPEREQLVGAITTLRRVLGAETLAHAHLLESIYRTTVSEFLLALSVLATLVLAGLITLVRVRSRLMRPLTELTHMLTRMSEQDYREVGTHNANPLIRPLFESYNRLVNRLTALEREHLEREESLRDAVQAATRTLMGYQQSLARAERLAAVGEVAAKLAHDLRNPLAGIRLACSNIQQDTEDPELAQRVGDVTQEVDRLIDVLNSHLARARHNPETPTRVVLAEVVSEVSRLLWYQLPERMQLHVDIPEDIECVVPETGLRQVLMNLLTNAWQALGEEAGEIWIHARLVDSRVRVVVEDNGPGFSDDALAYGPQAFATTKPGGTGLGLSMARRFTRELGGTLEFSNRTPGGARVTMEIPCNHV
ncbi:MAG TPA: ATP-binding protein [Gammaproteobacteria bacterium]|nr:ATP-binding protein [Gammaproteobacteria bacterium]